MNIAPVTVAAFKLNNSFLGAVSKNEAAVNPAVFHNTAKNSKMPDTLSFLGTYYATTDSHSRLPMAASTLSEIENRTQNRKNIDEPVFLLDCGDFTGDSYSFKSIADMYTTFQKRNPDVTCVFNLGNYDIDPLLDEGALLEHKEEIKDMLQEMADGGINIISASYCEAVEKLKKEGAEIDELEFIKPYIILDDIVDGKRQEVFLSGIGTRNKCGAKEQKAALDYLQEVCIKNDVKVDKAILFIHNNTKNTNELLDYAKETLGIKNIELAIGGHPHSIEDYMHGKTRVLYPPAQGKGAYEIKSTENGFEFEPLKLKSSGYNYSQLVGNPDVIDNFDINNPYPVKNAYKRILNDSVNSEYLEIITESSPYNLEFRDYNSKISMPTSFGTFMTNKYRDFTGADIALLRNQFLREKLPSKGKPVNWYNICDSINVNADLCRAAINTSKLKEILEISFEKQDRGLTNPSFLEYSDNLRITRRQKPKEDGNIVSQIEIKENGCWIKLLNEDGSPVDEERMFSLVSEDALMCGYLAQFANLNLNAEKIEDLTIRDVLTKALKEEKPNPDEPNYHTSEIINI